MIKLKPDYKFVKTFFDKVFAIIFILIFSPIILIISVLILFTSSGPIIYKHERLGLLGKKIYCYKFRTMHLESENKLNYLLRNNESIKKEFHQKFKIINDPRITKIGYFLRKTSLDEIPQFINVILGDMSVVGPRPIVSKESEKYGIYCDDLLSIKPGITGLWQVNGRNKNTYEQRVKLDMKYIKNMGFFFDLIIILKTIFIFLTLDSEGAY